LTLYLSVILGSGSGKLSASFLLTTSASLTPLGLNPSTKKNF